MNKESKLLIFIEVGRKIYIICRKHRGKAKWRLSVNVNLLVKENNRIIERIPVRLVYIPNRANARYMLIAVEQRESEDYRFCGELFMLFYQEL